MIPTLVAVSGMSIFALALLTSVISTKRSANHQADEYRLSSSVESVATLAMERLWSGYLDSQGGSAGSIVSFRNYLTALGIPNTPVDDLPKAGEGVNVLPLLAMSVAKDGKEVFQAVNVDTVSVVRNDVGDSTQVYLTISATTSRGEGMVNPTLDRALQQVYTVEPADFEGFDYAVLANNINCVFCHTKVDSAERYFNEDPALVGTFDRVKVGALESLMLRHSAGKDGLIKEGDSDSFVAGTLYIRGIATDQNGDPIGGSWSDLAFQGYLFDEAGKLAEDASGELATTAFSPAGYPPEPFENLYLDYPEEYGEMPDGNLPPGFPAPIPDDGGINPATGLPEPSLAGNKLVDDFEFDALAASALGAITAGQIKTIPKGQTLDLGAYAGAVMLGGDPSVQGTVDGNLVLTGTIDNPITIDGTVAIDGDVVISGYVKGEGTLIVRGNVYVPTDLQYLDGYTYLPGDQPGWPTGPRTFGIAEDGTLNALGMAAGGNVMIGDYLAPSTLQADLTLEVPAPYEIVGGSFDATVLAEDNLWNFTLAEMSLFNRGEWTKTQAFLPDSPGEADDLTDGTPIDPSTGMPETWIQNPEFVADYVPRYYHFGEDDVVPIYNKGDIYWDTASGAWHGDAEVPVSWDESMLSLADPNDPSDPLLYPAGAPAAVLLQATATDGWLPDDIYKVSIEWFEDNRPIGKPLTIDGLVYTNNAIFSLVNRYDGPYAGQMVVNGSLIAADLGMLAPGFEDPWGLSPNESPLSDYAIGLQVNYDKRLKDMLNVKNPLQVVLKRTLWNPTANVQ